MKTTMLLIMSILLLASSCRKDNEDAIDRSKMLTEGAWQINALTIEPAIDWFGTTVTNVYAQLPSCVKDNLTIFKTNGVVNYDEGSSKCDPNEPQTTTGTWAFNVDQTILSMTSEGETESWNLSVLDSRNIKADYQLQEGGINYTFTIQLNRK
ncbi:MAG: hypothetical protein IPL46_11140 [Saprospiraceae bacterium]|nr:hypothetical protein [Saprospiraceae bacterium]